LPALSRSTASLNGAAHAVVQSPKIAYLSPFSMQRDAGGANVRGNASVEH
jgi:hypothetical protein